MNTLVKVTALEDTYDTDYSYETELYNTVIDEPIEKTIMLDTGLVWCVEKTKKEWTKSSTQSYESTEKPPFWRFWCKPKTVKKYSYVYTDHSLDCYLIKLKDLPSMYILEDLWGLSDGAS